MIDLIDESTEEELHFKSSPDSWSILQCIEHICLVNKNVSRLLETPPPSSPSNQQSELYSEGKLNHLLVTKRELKRVAPGFVTPQGIYKSGEDAKNVIYEDTERILTILDEQDVSTQTHTIPHHALGEMTKTDWLHFMLAHTQRHLHQIGDIKEAYRNRKTD